MVMMMMMIFTAIFIIFFFFEIAAGQKDLMKVGFYSDTCPRSETIVASVVRQAAAADFTIPAALLRLHYHDCIVHGCDGSVLIMNTPDGLPENRSPNHAGLRGFDVIEKAKTELESNCPGVISCADIVALAARDSVFLSQGPFYQVPTGRRDGRVSNISDAANMPEFRDSNHVLREKFQAAGLSEKDLVLLNAAHTIGTTACFFVERRLYGGGAGTSAAINPLFLPELTFTCPLGGDVNARLALDRGSELVFDDSILRNIRAGFAAIGSDAELYTEASTRSIVDSYLPPPWSFSGAGGRNTKFEADFVESIVRMGLIGVHTGADGEIRRVCSEFN